MAEPIFDPRRILVVLAEYGVDFVVVGGVAVQAHGHGRATRDLDVIARPDLVNLNRLSEALAALGAQSIRADRPIDVTDSHLLERAPLLPLMTVHGRLDLRNAERTAGAPAYDALRERSFGVQLDGATVQVAGLDDLVRMKRAAGRPMDIADLGALMRTDEELEREASEST